MKIENITEDAKYTKPEDILTNSFFYDEVDEILYYVVLQDNEYLILDFEERRIRVGAKGNSISDAIKSMLLDTSRLRLIDSDDVKLTYKFKE